MIGSGDDGLAVFFKNILEPFPSLRPLLDDGSSSLPDLVSVELGLGVLVRPVELITRECVL